MKCTIRQMGANDRAIWAEMRIALWPGEAVREHAEMTDELVEMETFGVLSRKRQTVMLLVSQKLR